MAPARAEPFQIALNSLREKLREGGLAPGARVAAVEIADALRLSATPVREALSRLAGEGLLEDRRGQGFFVRMLGASDIADLYRISLAHLLIALEPNRMVRRPAASAPRTVGSEAERPPAEAPQEAVRAVERRFSEWIAQSGSRALIGAFRATQAQLGAVRRLEPFVLSDLEAEGRALLALGSPDARAERLAAIRQYHGRRIRLAETFATLLERSGESKL